LVADGLLAPATDELRRFGASLLAGDVIYFPVRHHSPACAFHLKQLINNRRPRQVLIEGPTAFDQTIDLLADPAAKPPLALYSSCRQRDDATAPPGAGSGRRRGAYYPMCAYSPEWVAVREARQIGARIRFIDLDFHKQVAIDQSNRLSSRVATLFDERHFQRSAHLRRLALERGCRNHDELWDRLFEVWHGQVSTETFVAQLATYCRLARQDVTDAEHERDGTLAREAEMAWHVSAALREARRTNDPERRPLLVVTGGYHTVALPALVAAKPARPSIDASQVVDSRTVLIRYSFDRLDRLTGYGAGMPSPAFYQRLWDAASQGQKTDSVALDILFDLADRVRAAGHDQAPTAATVTAACEQVQRLAQLRGNPAPTRDDVLDAISSCYVKGAVDAEGRVILALALALLSGSTVGEVPPAAGLPPIVDDFNARARQLRFRLDDTDTKQAVLDVYRDAGDRDRSQFLHLVAFLDVPFAARLAGPDFTGRQAGRRLQEQWTYAWSPQVDAALIDAASHGNTIREAAANRFIECRSPKITAAADQPQRRSSNCREPVSWDCTSSQTVC
jgi:hypothetical protein